jgi:hypothetical protein
VNASRTSLDLIQIASPCPASWESMKGDARVRFCGECRLNVYNLSEMSRGEAETFVSQREGRTCVRFFRREDGTVLTKDCPVGLRALRQRFVRATAALCGILVALISGTLFGGAISRRLPGGIRPPSEAFADWIDPTRRMVMGDVAGMLGGMPAPPVVFRVPTTVAQPAETPLLDPTPAQLEEIQRRLQDEATQF